MATSLLALALAGCGEGGGGGSPYVAPLTFVPLFGPPQLITEDAAGVGSLAAGDLDGDGDGDVLAISQIDGTVTWHENADGAGGAWVEHEIAGLAAGANAVVAIDLDCDGDLDAVVTAFAAGVRWYENLDGLGLDWADHLISFTPAQPMGVFAGDFDGDGHHDVLAGSFAGGEVVCFLNLDGEGTTWSPRTVVTGESAPIAVSAGDVDGGDCLDPLVASAYSGQVAWHDNAGCLATSWPRTTVATGLATPVALVGGDADGDGDLDVITASLSGDRVDLHRNLDGLGASWDQVAISTSSDGVHAVWAGDLDCDGDLDVLSAAEVGDTVAWHENAGEDASLWTTHVINALAEGVTAVLGADIDGDGLTDAVSASTGAGTIEWYRNLLPGTGLTTSDPPDQIVCVGETVTFTTTPTGLGPFSYEWVIACTGEVLGTGPSLTLTDVGPEDGCTYTVHVTADFRTASESVVLTVLEAAGAADPADQSACAGQAVSFTTTASGSGPFSYTWTKSGSDGVLGTLPTLDLGFVDAADAGSYTVSVTGGCGSAVQSVALTVNGPVAASDPPDASVCDGATASFTTLPSGSGPFSFQWTKTGSAAVLGTSATLTLSGVGPSSAGSYEVLVTGPCGSAVQSAVLSVGAAVAATAPGDLVACPGGTAVFSTVASGSGPFTYSWTKSGSGAVLGTGSTLSLSNVGPANAGLYTVAVTGTCGTANATGSLVLGGPPLLTPLPDLNVAAGALGVQLGPVVAGGNPPFTYTWTKDGLPLPGQTGPSLTLAKALPEDAGAYCVTVSGACGASSECFQLTVGTLDGSNSGGRKLGSLLVFPVHTSVNGSFTVLSVTNTNTQVETPISLGGSTNLHFEYINAVPNLQNPFRPLSCDVFDRVESLTPADTLALMTACHNPTVGGAEGYVVVSAQDPELFSAPWAHNHLVGSELVVKASGAGFLLNAIVFSAVPEAGDPTDVDQDGNLDLDGIEYTPVADTLLVPSFLSLADSNLSLINLTGSPSDVNTVRFNVWNDNEFQLSADIQFNCWFDQPLDLISPIFSQGFLQGTPSDPNELDANCNGVQDMEVGWMLIDSGGVATTGGTHVAGDGALLGALTAGSSQVLVASELLWESNATQGNGAATTP